MQAQITHKSPMYQIEHCNGLINCHVPFHALTSLAEFVSNTSCLHTT